jgi:hypothetical protein
MAEAAARFLEKWRRDYIYAEPRALEQVDATVAECMDDAAKAEISSSALQGAAGGDLRGYILNAIVKASGGG